MDNQNSIHPDIKKLSEIYLAVSSWIILLSIQTFPYCTHDIPSVADTFEFLSEYEDNKEAQKTLVKAELGLGEAFLRFLQLISCGFLTPKSSGLVDNLTGQENLIDPAVTLGNGANIHTNTIHEEFEEQKMENLMCCAQTLYRM